MGRYEWPTSEQIDNRLQEILAGGEHYNFRFPWQEYPIVFSRGVGARVWDVDGNEFLDFYSGFGAVIVGHGNHSYLRVIGDCAERLLAVSHSELDEEVAALLIRYVPSAEMVRFVVTGTEAVQAAIRLARAHTGRNRFVRFVGHYHGHADNVLGGRPQGREQPIPIAFDNDPRGSEGLADGIRESQSFLLPWNDAEAIERVINEHADEIAAIIMEPICFNGGGFMPAEGYLPLVRSLCDRHGIVLVFDEIVTGFRVALGGAQALLGVVPDLTTLGKHMGGGAVPVAAVVGKREIMSLLANHRVAVAGTFNGYPLGLAATKATVDALTKNDGHALKAMHSRTDRLRDQIVEAGRREGFAISVQGPPGCFYYHCTEAPLKSPEDWRLDILRRDVLLRESLLRQGVLTAPPGRFYPTLALTDDDAMEFGKRVRAAVSVASSQART